jgi:hypothetical protein
MKRTTLLAMLIPFAVLAWVISLSVAFASNAPLAEGGGCKVVHSNPLPSRQKLARTTMQQLEPIPPVPVPDNCTKFGSCRKTGCWRVFGGSQKTFSNRIPGCVKDPNPKCFDVQCYVETFYTGDCTGEKEASWVTKRGCRRS